MLWIPFAFTSREGQVLPHLKIPLLGPSSEQQYICVKLLDHNKQLLSSWNHKPSSSSRGSSKSGRHTIRQLSQQQQQQHNKQAEAMQQPQHKQQQQQQCLVYQQQVLSQDGVRRIAVGHRQQQVALQELWVSPPAPGTYYVHVSTEALQQTNSRAIYASRSADAATQ
jgi:hypothetical protein